MNFQFTNQKYTNKINVWHKNIFIGTIELHIKENPDVDWKSLREDKTLRLKSTERWIYTWNASSSPNISTIGNFLSKEDAAVAILNDHHKKFNKENDQ